MQELHLFEYAVIRIMPRVEREEFLNAGVILLCKQQNFLQAKYEVNPQRIHALCPNCDVEELTKHLEAFARIAAGDPAAGPIAQLDIAGRFRWLSAKRSTVLQPSQVHPGLCHDAAQMLERLFQEMVL